MLNSVKLFIVTFYYDFYLSSCHQDPHNHNPHHDILCIYIVLFKFKSTQQTHQAINHQEESVLGRILSSNCIPYMSLEILLHRNDSGLQFHVTCQHLSDFKYTFSPIKLTVLVLGSKESNFTILLRLKVTSFHLGISRQQSHVLYI